MPTKKPTLTRRQKSLALHLIQRSLETFQADDTWTQGWFANDKQGCSCSALNDQATQWDMLGAIQLATEYFKSKNVPPRVLDGSITAVNLCLIDTIRAAYPDDPELQKRGPIVWFNDYVAQDVSDVRVILEGALLLCEEEVPVVAPKRKEPPSAQPVPPLD